MSIFLSKKIKKAVVLFLAIIMVFGLLACGRDGQSTGNRDGYVYIPEYVSLEAEENSHRNVYQMIDNAIYYQLYRYDPTTYESTNILCKLDIFNADAQPEQIPIEFGNNKNIMNLTIDGEGRVHMATQDYSDVDPATGMVNYERASYFLEGYQQDGTLLYKVDISTYFTDSMYMYIQAITADNDGNIYMTDGNNKIVVFDGNGNYLFDVSSSAGWINTMGKGKSGTIYIVQYSQTAGGMELVPIDLAARGFGAALTGIPSNVQRILPGNEKDLLLYDGNGLFEYDIETKTSEKVLDFLDADVNSNNIRIVSVLEDGRIFAYLEDYSNEMPASEIILLTKTKASEVAEKETLVLGVFGTSYEMRGYIIQFNKSNDKYRITLRDYTENVNWSDNNAYQDAITSMNNEITSGNSPDMIDLSSISDVGVLTAKGVLEDLNPYLEKSTKLNKEDLLEPVLDAFTIGGVLYGIPTTFYISTLFGKTSAVGDKMGWTFDDLMEVVRTMPEGSEIMQGATKDGILYASMAFNVSDFIDWETGKCNFNSDGFIKILEFANQFPNDYSWDEHTPSFIKLVRENRLLLHATSISRVEDVQIMRKAFGEPVTAIGYPTSSGNGAAISGQAIAISSRSKHKDIAWQFLESYILEGASNERYSWGLPILKSKLEEKFVEATTPQYYYDENGEIVVDEEGNPMEMHNMSVGFGGGPDDYIDIDVSTQEDVDVVKALIESTTQIANYNSSVLSIITEEAAAYFSGQKTPGEVAEIIQSRVQILVNESL